MLLYPDTVAILGQMESTVLLDVNGIRVRGLASKPSGVEKYLGIPFARVTQRFRPAQRVPLATLGPELNATAFGPRCPQAWNYGPQRRKHLYEGAPSSWNDQTSETNCLSVNVYVPPRTTVDVSDLPVLVWIHGGGWVFGDGGAEYGMKRLRLILLSPLLASDLRRWDFAHQGGLSAWKTFRRRDDELSTRILRLS